MLQEIITYIIIALAITVAVQKTIKKFRKRRHHARQHSSVSGKQAVETNCDECSAECILRDINTPAAKGNDLCKKFTVTSNKL